MRKNALWIFAAGSLVLAGLVIPSCTDDGPSLGGATTSTTGAGGNGSGASGSGGNGTGGALPNDCGSYCQTIMQTCTDENAMYASDSDCNYVCQNLPAGKVGVTSGNSLACRNYYLKFAVEGTAEPDTVFTHCRYAGPGTEGKCGGSCENFCYLAQKVCTGEQQQWPSEEACKTDCAKFSQTGDYSAGAEGNNFACRLYHLTVAANNPLQHCAHIAKDSEVCIDPPEMDGGLGGGGGGGGMMMDGGMDSGMMDGGMDSGMGGGGGAGGN